MKRKASSELEDDRQSKRIKPTTLTRDPWKVIVKFLGQCDYASWLLTHRGAKQLKFDPLSVRVFDGNLLPPMDRMPEHWFWRRRIRVESLKAKWSRNVDLPDFDIEAVSTDVSKIANVKCRQLMFFGCTDLLASKLGLHTTVLTCDLETWRDTSFFTYQYCEDLTLRFVVLGLSLRTTALQLRRLRGELHHTDYCFERVLPEKLEYLELSNAKCETCISRIRELCAKQNCTLKLI
jgi:hypothetical protein